MAFVFGGWKDTKNAERSALPQAKRVTKKYRLRIEKFDDPGDSHVDRTVQERNKASGRKSTKRKKKKRPKNNTGRKGATYKMSIVEKFIDTTRRLMANRPRVNKYDLLEKGVSPEIIEKIEEKVDVEETIIEHPTPDDKEKEDETEQ